MLLKGQSKVDDVVVKTGSRIGFRSEGSGVCCDGWG